MELSQLVLVIPNYVKYFDNHGSGYLGMAKCFNVHR